MKCWFLDETEVPEEKPLTAEQRREPYNKLIPHNRELMQLQPNKTKILHLQYSWRFWYISSPVMRWLRREISLLSKKSTQVDDFLFLFLNWLGDGQSFLRHRKQWMVVIGNGNFYPRQNRLLISILFKTKTKFSIWLAINCPDFSTVGQCNSTVLVIPPTRTRKWLFFTASKKTIGLSCVLSLNMSLKYQKFCYNYDLLVTELRVVQFAYRWLNKWNSRYAVVRFC